VRRQTTQDRTLDSSGNTPSTDQPAYTNGLSFAGVGQGDYGFSDQYAPPDTNGAVGATQHVQWVNTYFAVFDKKTGALTPGLGAICNNNHAGCGNVGVADTGAQIGLSGLERLLQYDHSGSENRHRPDLHDLLHIGM
jgi:hypothetical protein